MTYFTTTVTSPCGPLCCIVDEPGAVVRIEFASCRDGESFRRRLQAVGDRLMEDRKRTGEVRRQLGEYFAGRRRRFELPLAPEGSPFQQRVWAVLQSIPYGETRSYGELARALGRPGASRAVGAANGANPIPIVIPCHRVIGADGSLTGFGGGLEAKKLLLDLEARHRPGRPGEQMRLDLAPRPAADGRG